VGTGAGGIVGPLLFANWIGSGSRHQVALAFYLGRADLAHRRGAGQVELIPAACRAAANEPYRSIRRSALSQGPPGPAANSL
jgi:hypothetical protein